MVIVGSNGMAKSQAEYKRVQRERKRAEGYVLKQIWVKPDKWGSIKELIKETDNVTNK